MLAKTRSDFGRQLLAFLPMLVNSFVCSCHSNWLSNAAFYLTQPDNVPSLTVSECTVLGSCLAAGQIISSWQSGVLFDKLGSKKVTFIVACLNCASWTAFIFDTDAITLCILRIFSGIGLAMNFCVYAALTGELSSTEFRSVHCTIQTVISRSSSLFLGCVSLVCSSYRSLAISAAAASVAAFVPVSSFASESPYFLARTGDRDAALRTLATLHPNLPAARIRGKFDHLERLIESERSIGGGGGGDAASWRRFFAQKAFRRVFLRVCLVNGCSSLSGRVLMTYATVVLPTNAYAPNSAYPLLFNWAVLLAQFCLMATIERFPRRSLFGVACLANACALCFTGTAFWCGRSETSAGLLIGGFAVSVVLHGALVEPLMEIVTSELFPASVKGKANAYVYSVRCALTVVSLQSFDLVRTNVGVFANFYLCATASVALAFVVYFTLPETRGKSLVDLQFDVSVAKDERSSRGISDPAVPMYGSVARGEDTIAGSENCVS